MKQQEVQELDIDLVMIWRRSISSYSILIINIAHDFYGKYSYYILNFDPRSYHDLASISRQQIRLIVHKEKGNTWKGTSCSDYNRIITTTKQENTRVA